MLVKEKIVASRFIIKIIGIIRQDFCIDLIQLQRIKMLGGRIRETRNGT